MKETWQMIKNDLKIYIPIMIGICVIFGSMNAVWGTICPLRMMTGFPCPACGMTRALLLCLQGKFVEAFHMHPVYPAIIFLAVQFVIKKYIVKKSLQGMNKYIIIVLILLIVVYLWRMWGSFPGEEPMTFNRHNIIHDMIQYIRWFSSGVWIS